MPIKIEYKSEQEVRDIPMTGLVSYSDVIDETYRLIEEKGFKVQHVSYRPNSNGDTVTAFYVLEDIEGAENEHLSPCITWTHSYHKAIRFSCNISAMYKLNDVQLVPGVKTEAGKARRSSDVEKYKTEIFEDLGLELSFIKTEFLNIVSFKELLESKACNIGTASITLGMLYLEEDVLTTSQASVVKDLVKNVKLENGWDMYQVFAEALKETHPKLYLQNHTNLYSLFHDIFTSEPVQETEEIKPEEIKNIKSEVDKEILEDHNFISRMPSVVFL